MESENRDLIEEKRSEEERKEKVSQAMQYIWPHYRHMCFMLGGLGCTQESCNEKKKCWFFECRNLSADMSKLLEKYNTEPATEEEQNLGYTEKVNKIREEYKAKKEKEKIQNG